MDRRSFVKVTGLAGLTGLAGCTGGPGGSEETTTTESSGGEGGEETTTAAEETTQSSEDTTNVGMVYATGGLGDGSFNDQAQQGAIRARDELGVSFDESQPDEVSQFKTFQQQFAESTNPNYDLVCCIGFLQTDALIETSEAYPEQNFMLVDSVVESPNVANYVFAEHEGSYLVGQMAGLLTTQEFSAGTGATSPDSTSVGFVGGVESDLIKKFEAGFKAGVKAANADVEVLTNYTGSFNDPAAGKEAALAMYNSGADIVYHASGNTGTGVFQAAQEQGKFAIGVDRDQSVTKSSYADVILASMVKRVNTAVYNSIESVVNEEFQGGGIVSLGLEQNGVDIVYGDSLSSEIPTEVKDEVAASRESIVAGDVTVPTDPSDV
ncbi:BMP family ABC transporter substrate-binding protein [Haloferax sp. MBLA0076]|uniref:BMP family ABC transporter substrate-binding protein n=1 Tax=Haloferax litoreum TaxID=2666140 RepID=A0A6A8GJE5_9EURY|nr:MULTISPECIES: BMP family protein [Haloferax]KAB1194376.1 BMP family ABC transporter substrate-binding protein [Haloferax sp. CBA1148]MRX22939.1 BMP family ABC transporter substrate-binding protein [Haloferax litoreum]